MTEGHLLRPRLRPKTSPLEVLFIIAEEKIQNYSQLCLFRVIIGPVELVPSQTCLLSFVRRTRLQAHIVVIC